MEAINESTKLIAQAIDLLDILNYATIEHEESTIKAIGLLKIALDKLVVEI